ncbi:MAG: polyprenyl synthetase family protein [Lautropia sp.]|nr:polyprenyl synthetase family protein [Lautropia sp.]
MNKNGLLSAAGLVAEKVTAPLPLDAWMQARAGHVECVLQKVLPASPSGMAPGLAPEQLHEAMRYAVLGGGKRVRPLLVYAAGELVDASPAVLDGAACAVELIHAYSLVHDDMPAMDNDDMRRGKPTVHKQFGEATAMLVGDALQALAFEALTAPLLGQAGQAVPVARMVSGLAKAAGAAGMAGGQALDMAGVGHRLTREQLERMHQLKTGAMLSVSTDLGLLAGGEPSPALSEAIGHYGRVIGLAFQVVDDILDVTADSATLGKTAGKDQAQDKPTYVSMLGLDEARALAIDLRAQAHACLAGLGPGADRLRQLADFIVDRFH